MSASHALIIMLPELILHGIWYHTAFNLLSHRGPSPIGPAAMCSPALAHLITLLHFRVNPFPISKRRNEVIIRSICRVIIPNFYILVIYFQFVCLFQISSCKLFRTLYINNCSVFSLNSRTSQCLSLDP